MTKDMPRPAEQGPASREVAVSERQFKRYGQLAVGCWRWDHMLLGTTIIARGWQGVHGTAGATVPVFSRCEAIGDEGAWGIRR